MQRAQRPLARRETVPVVKSPTKSFWGIGSKIGGFYVLWGRFLKYPGWLVGCPKRVAEAWFAKKTSREKLYSIGKGIYT